MLLINVFLQIFCGLLHFQLVIANLVSQIKWI